jgi:hypothetical protein
MSSTNGLMEGKPTDGISPKKKLDTGSTNKLPSKYGVDGVMERREFDCKIKKKRGKK